MPRFQLPSVGSAAVKLALAFVVVSVVAAVTFDSVGIYLRLMPDMVMHGFVWQLLTYAFVATSPLSVIFGALMLVSLGNSLQSVWGTRRTLAMALGVPIAAAVLIVLLSLAYVPLRGVAFSGDFVLPCTLWVAFGLYLGERPTNFWGVTLSGNLFALLAVGFIALDAAFARSILPVLVDAVACALTFVVVRFGGPNVWWLRFSNWRLQRQLRGRSKHLRVISKDRNHPSDSDRYLQ